MTSTAATQKLAPVAPFKLEATPETLRDENQSMKACAWYGAEDMRLVEIKKPKVTDPRDAIIRVTTTTICGSDLHMYYNKVPGSGAMQKGDIMGHECMGIVESIGPQVKNLAVGDRVVVSAVISCGECMYCKRQQFSLCDRTNPSTLVENLYGFRLSGIFGYSHLTGGYDGGQAEYVRVPLADLTCLKVPPNLSDEKVLFLSDIACTSYHANEFAETGPGKTVCIWGMGPVGLLTVQWARVRGASRIIAIDKEDYRLEVAKKLGAEVINASKTDVVDTILKMLPNGPECVIETAGFRFPKTIAQRVEATLHLETDATDIINEMVKVCQKGGNMALIGDYFAYGNHFPVGGLMEKGITLRGSQVYVQKYWGVLLDLIQQGKFDPTVVITHTMPFEKISEAYKMFANHQDRSLKILLKTRYGESLISQSR